MIGNPRLIHNPNYIIQGVDYEQIAKETSISLREYFTALSDIKWYLKTNKINVVKQLKISINRNADIKTIYVKDNKIVNKIRI